MSCVRRLHHAEVVRLDVKVSPAGIMHVLDSLQSWHRYESRLEPVACWIKVRASSLLSAVRTNNQTKCRVYMNNCAGRVLSTLNLADICATMQTLK